MGPLKRAPAARFLFELYWRVGRSMDRISGSGPRSVVANHSGRCTNALMSAHAVERANRRSCRSRGRLAITAAVRPPPLAKLGGARAMLENRQRPLTWPFDSLRRCVPDGAKGPQGLSLRAIASNSFGRGGVIRVAPTSARALVPV